MVILTKCILMLRELLGVEPPLVDCENRNFINLDICNGLKS